MTPLVTIDRVSHSFQPRVTLGERIAATLGAVAETPSVQAVDDVSLTIARGEVLGLAGESGCGKSTLGRIVAGILKPSVGSMLIDGRPVMTGAARPVKISTSVQMVFQDPFASLDPRQRIGDALTEGPVAHGLVKRGDASGYAERWLAAVGLDAGMAGRLPHQFSGGQRQRIAIARALAMRPDVIVADEPVASLDVSIQAQIVNLLLRLRRDLKLTMLFISHDLGVVRHVSDRVAIMYLGRIVESGATDQLFTSPRHPYSRALLDSVPRLRLTDEEVAFRPIAGEVPSAMKPPSGCHFHVRCPRVQPICRIDRPLLESDAGHAVACYNPL